MPKYLFDLYNKSDLQEFYLKYFLKKYPLISYEELESRIEFLRISGLNKKWVYINPTTIGEYAVFCNQLNIEKMVIAIPLIYIYHLASYLEVLDRTDVQHYISKFNSNSTDQITYCYEIEIGSNLRKSGFEIEVDPLTGAIGKSGVKRKVISRLDIWVLTFS